MRLHNNTLAVYLIIAYLIILAPGDHGPVRPLYTHTNQPSINKYWKENTHDADIFGAEIATPLPVIISWHLDQHCSCWGEFSFLSPLELSLAPLGQCSLGLPPKPHD